MKLTFSSFVLVLFLATTWNASASTTWYVNGVSGSDSNSCLSATAACKTIGHAISLSSSGDAIKVAPATYRENLNIGISLKIIGSGGRPVIDGGGVNTVVTVSSVAANVTLSGLRIQNGSSLSSAGGVSNVGELTLNSSTVESNFGLGISNSGAMTISSSTIAKNTTTNDFGNGIYNYPSGTLILTGTTVSQNTTGVICETKFCFIVNGGIWNDGKAILNNSTISGNYGYMAGCKVLFGCNPLYSGGGIVNSGTLEVSNSTVSANGSSGVDSCCGTVILQNSILSSNGTFNCNGPVSSSGYNLSSDASCNFTGSGDLNNTDPLLGPLQNNGGPTQTMALLSGSPAIDAGNPAGCTDGNGNLLKTDQRGQPRPDKEDTSGCDIGAYESQSD